MEFFLDTHTHTVNSGHAYNTMEEMVCRAAEIGLEIIGITEHAPKMPGTCHEFYFHNLRAVDREYLQKKFGIEVLLGAELNIMDQEGGLDLDRRGLEELDIAIASMHLPCIKPGSKEENTRAVIAALQNPYVDIIGHPDDGRYPMDYEAIVCAAKKYGKLLEVNNSSLMPNGYRKNAGENDKELLKYCMKYDQPVVVNSDAHFVSAVGAHNYADAIFRELNFPEKLVLNGFPEEFRKYIRKYRKNQ